MIQPRDEAHMFLLELWAEHAKLTTGTEFKVWHPNVEKEFFIHNPTKAFELDKPIQFKQLDDYISNLNIGTLTARVAIIDLADNRMVQGDVRYGAIKRQNLMAYDTIAEYHKRYELAMEHKSLELLIDAYNMARIQYFKDNQYDIACHRARTIIMRYAHAINFGIGWTFEDKTGTHAEKKTQ